MIEPLNVELSLALPNFNLILHNFNPICVISSDLLCNLNLKCNMNCLDWYLNYVNAFYFCMVCRMKMETSGEKEVGSASVSTSGQVSFKYLLLINTTSFHTK